jgi:hypothetical protein
MGDDSCLLPGASLFGDAVQVWSVAQDARTNVFQAAAVFNVTTELIRQAIDVHQGMYLSFGDVIEHVFE